jgi:hypothetical protein
MNNLRLIERIDAGLRVPGDSILPDAFDLHVETARITYRVQMCWRMGDRVGVAF